MGKDVSYGEEARKSLRKGVDALANAVKATLGPQGKTVIISTYTGKTIITKDGVTVAKEFDLRDQRENMGVTIVKEVASKTDDIAGDGTTTATVLAQKILELGDKELSKGTKPSQLRKGIELATREIIKNLDKAKVDISEDFERLFQIATISANGDTAIGTLITEAYKEVGSDGVITVSESSSTETFTKLTEGLEFDRGFLSPYFITHPDRGLVILDNPLVLLYDQEISMASELMPAAEAAVKAGRSLLVIAEDITGEALSFLVTNKIRGTLRVCAVKAPSFGDQRIEMLKDIAVRVSAQIISRAKGMTLDAGDEHAEGFDPEWLGAVETAEIGRENIILVNGAGEEEDVAERVSQLKNEMSVQENQNEVVKLNKRIARLQGKVAVISVGAYSEAELGEKKDRVIDALSASKAALIDGVIAGGGVALIRAGKKASKVVSKIEDETVRRSAELVIEAVSAPFFQILVNADLQPEPIFKNVLAGKENYGFDARNEVYGDMFEMGILDPVMVTKTALENASSVAALILNSECLMIDQKHGGDFVPLNA